jgi:RNA polymerase sigma-70 factor (ECF subfamily)
LIIPLQRFAFTERHYNKQGNSMSEQRLILACKQGKLWARKEVYDQYAPSMMALCRRYVSDVEDAKDVLQEGFLKIFVEIGQYSGKGSFGGWIRKIFVNTSLDYMRKKNRLKQKELLMDVQIEYPATVSDMADINITADELIHCIDELPDTHRTVFNLFAVEGFSHREIAALLNMPESTSRSFFFRARQLLQKRVKELMDHR